MMARAFELLSFLKAVPCPAYGARILRGNHDQGLYSSTEKSVKPAISARALARLRLQEQEERSWIADVVKAMTLV